MFTRWKNPLYRRLRGGSNPRRSITQDSRPTKLSRPLNRFVGLVVKASASRAEDPGFESRLRLDFSGSSHTSDSKFDTPVANLPGSWQYRVSTGTGGPGVSIL